MSDSGGPLSPDRPDVDRDFRVDAPATPAGTHPPRNTLVTTHNKTQVALGLRDEDVCRPGT